MADLLTRRDMGGHLGVSVRSVAEWLHDLDPSLSVGTGSARRWRPEAVEALHRIRAERAAERRASHPPSRRSEALERYRAARAGLVELELRERSGELVARDVVTELTARAFARLVEAVRRLEADFGPRAADIYSEAVAAANEAMRHGIEHLPARK